MYNFGISECNRVKQQLANSTDLNQSCKWKIEYGRPQRFNSQALASGLSC